MLRELRITNLAILGKASVEFGPGLTCLTGETGAGKSILVDALGLALGGRSDSDMAGPEGAATVEALFDASGVPAVTGYLGEMDIDCPDGELVVRRVINPNGRSKAYINGSLVNVSALQQVGERLVDIHGQHEHQSLLRVESHADLLDMHLGLGADRAAYEDAYRARNELRARLEKLRSESRERERRLDLLRYQADEIDAAGLDADEEETITAERAVLANADKINGLAAAALDAMRDSEVSALTLAADAADALREIAGLVPGQDEALKLIESAAISIEEAASGLRRFADTVEADPERLASVDDRLHLIRGLKKKYGDTVQDVLKYRAGIGIELEGLEYADEEDATLVKRLADADRKLVDAGGKLSGLRKKGAPGFRKQVAGELSSLGMPKAQFEPSFEPYDAPGPDGMERVEFMFSANPGMGMRPLAKVASGGELSRLTLALKVVLSREDPVPTLVFDEVDAGIGGRTATAVGERLKSVAKTRQALCVTHLPQVASFADAHISVTKTSGGGSTEVTVRRLDDEGRVAELARMLGGDDLATASAHARELVRQGSS